MPFVRRQGLLPIYILLPKYILIIEAKVHLRRMPHAIFMYIVLRASVKNTLSSPADSLGNFEMCPCNKISYHSVDSETQQPSKVFI